MEKNYEYDIALSFAGEDRKYVDEVANGLRELEISVFYDLFEEEKLWGKNLYSYLAAIYRHKAKYTIMFISEHYAKKLWTNHEREAMQARAFEESREYILPARFDDTDIPGVLPDIGYISLENKTPEEFVKLIQKKLNQEARITQSDEEASLTLQTGEVPIDDDKPIYQNEHIPPYKILYPVFFQPFVLAGGLGTRVIHLSPTKLPKQFWRVYGRASMLQDAIIRLIKFRDIDRPGLPIVLSIDKISDKISSQVSELEISKHISHKNLKIDSWFEPDRKGTAIAILYALIKLKKEDKIAEDTVLGFFPADQNIYINDKNNFSNKSAHQLFRHSLRQAFIEAHRGRSIVLLGSRIYSGQEGEVIGSRYGWIKVTDQHYDNTRDVISFVEKPPKEVIPSMLKKNPEYWLWNTGVFIAEASLLEKVFKFALPDAWDLMGKDDINFDLKYNELKIEKLMFDDILENLLKVNNTPDISIKVVTVGYAWEDLGHPETIRDHYLRKKWMWEKYADQDPVDREKIKRSMNDFEIEISDLADSDATFLVYQLKGSNDVQVAKLKEVK